MVDMRSVSPEEGAALLDVTRRLARQIEHQLAQLRRLREGARGDHPVTDTGLGDLEHGARRLHRDTERLRLLCGDDVTVGDARGVGQVLGDAAAASAEPVRVAVRPAPVATIGPRAAVELAHVLAEVLDGALAETALGVSVGGRLGPAGLTVDVTVEGPRRDSGRAAGGVAEALARCSASGIQVHRSGPDGPYAIVLCPSASITVPVQRREPPRAPAMYDLGPGGRPDPLSGTLPQRPDSLAAPARAERPDPFAGPVPPERPDPLAEPVRSEPPAAVERPDAPAAEDPPRREAPGLPQRIDPRDPLGVDGLVRSRPPGGDMFGVRSEGSAGGSTLFGASPAGAGPSRPGARGGPPANRPAAVPPLGNRRNGTANGHAEAFVPRGRPDLPPGSDPLFGPLPVRDTADPVSTPIYEAVVSAWFREPGAPGPDWESPGDAEWQAAAARAAQADRPDTTTASGLPRRRPGRQMVTPPLQRARATPVEVRSEERAPERVRERLDGYQRGLRQGRHRASEQEPPPGRATRWA